MIPDLGKGLTILVVVLALIVFLIAYLLGMTTTRSVDLTTHQLTCTNYNKHGDCIEGIINPK